MSTKPPNATLERLFAWSCFLAAALPLSLLAYLLGDVALDGAGRLSWDFLTGLPSRRAAKAGLLPALVGSIYLVALMGLIALPLGVGAALYLEEYGRRGRLATLIEVNIANLAGIPSIIYGLVGLEVFVRFFAMGRSVMAGSLALTLLVLPIIIMSTREALRTVPLALRESAMALGATRWQVTRQVVLPQALPGIVTGAILAVARAIGEAAPLIVLGAVVYIEGVPRYPTDEFTALPIQIFNWASRPQEAFHANAAAGIVILMVMLLGFNGVAIVIRNRSQVKR